MLQIKKVSKWFGNRPVVQDLSFEVRASEVLVILGPSGCGKTTLLRMIAGLEEIDEGSITLFDRDLRMLAPKDRQIAMVFQNPALNPHLSCFENIAYPLVVRKEKVETRRQKVEEKASGLKLDAHILNSSPTRVSGGEAQRVALARALVRDPRCFLLDEPLSALDPHMRTTARREIRNMHRGLANQTQAMMIFVTHDQDDAVAIADRIAIMKHGRFEQIGTPQEIFDRPQSKFVGEFFGRPPMNLICADIATGPTGQLEAHLLSPDRSRQILSLPTSPLPKTGSSVQCGIRPTSISAWSPSKPCPSQFQQLCLAKVLDVEGVGEGVFAYCETDLGPLYVKSSERPRSGDKVLLGLTPDSVHWFDGETGLRCS